MCKFLLGNAEGKMLKKKFVLLVFFLNLTLFLPVLKAQESIEQTYQKFEEMVKQGISQKQIYEKLKQPHEPMVMFFARMQLYGREKNKNNNVETNYPYQKPQAFDPKHILNDFYFLGNITVHGDNADKWALKQQNGQLLANLQANKLQELSPQGLKPSHEDVYKEMQQFRINDGKSSAYILSPISTKIKVPEVHVLLEKNKNIVTMYIGNPTSTQNLTVKDDAGGEHTESVSVPTKGFKIIYDDNKFRDYLTQTFFYKILLNNGKDPVVGFGFGFTIDPTKVALINTSDVAQVIDIFNIKLIFKVTKQGVTIKDGKFVNDSKNKQIYTYYASEPLAMQDKIKEKNYEETIKYADLFAVGAIRVEPLDSADAKKLDSMK